MADTELLPCAHCGCEPMMEEHPAHSHSVALQALVPGLPDHLGSWTIECPTSGCVALIGDTCPDVITAWNRRESLASRPAEVDDWISVDERLPEIGSEVLVYRPNSERGTVTALARFIRYEGASDFYWDNSYPGKGNMHLDTSITHWRPVPSAPSHTTNKDGT